MFTVLRAHQQRDSFATQSKWSDCILYKIVVHLHIKVLAYFIKFAHLLLQ